MNKGNLENESFWAHRLPVNTKLYGNKTNVVGAILYNYTTGCGNWTL